MYGVNEMDKENTFVLKRHMPVLIYGAGAYGRNIYYRIQDFFTVVGFIDKNVQSLPDINLPVLNLEHATAYKDCTVVVCTHNANWHCEIAEDLCRQGFEKIIFLAVSDMYTPMQAHMMNKIYNLFLEEQYHSLTGIPCYHTMKNISAAGSVIRENDTYMIAWCGKDLLYSYDKVEDHQKNKILEESRYYLDVPMIAFKPYTELFRFFMYGSGSTDIYLRNMKPLNNSFDMSDKQFLQEQYEIYCLLEKEYEKGNEAFQYMPIDVAWNKEGGYFNITDGHHRCIFYWLKGLQSMPVRMRREDFDIWMNAGDLGRAETALQKGRVDFRINHPVLREYKSRYLEYETTVLDIFQEWIYDTRHIFRASLELSNYQAYYSYHLYKMHRAEKITAMVETESVELAEALRALQYIPDNAIRVVDRFDDIMDYMPLFDLGIVCGRYNVQELENILPHLDSNIESTLFWQSACDAEAERQYIIAHSGFQNYKMLAKKCFQGRLCEVGVFSK